MIGRSKAEVLPKVELPYLLRYNGNAVMHEDFLFYPPENFGYSMEDYVRRIEKTKKNLPIEVLPQKINPYALGHLINHPPVETPPNVCFIDFEVPESFFPSFFLNHFPYMRFAIPPAAKPEPFQAVGIISVEPLHNQELFVNYGHERFPENFAPEWLVDPPDNLPISNYLLKEDCLYEFTRLTKLLLKFDNFSLTELEKAQKAMQEDKEKRLKEALEDPKLFEKFYKKS